MNIRYNHLYNLYVTFTGEYITFKIVSETFDAHRLRGKNSQFMSGKY